jgi:hypothetical protein
MSPRRDVSGNGVSELIVAVLAAVAIRKLLGGVALLCGTVPR